MVRNEAGGMEKERIKQIWWIEPCNNSSHAKHRAAWSPLPSWNFSFLWLPAAAPAAPDQWNASKSTQQELICYPPEAVCGVILERKVEEKEDKAADKEDHKGGGVWLGAGRCGATSSKYLLHSCFLLLLDIFLFCQVVEKGMEGSREPLLILEQKYLKGFTSYTIQVNGYDDLNKQMMTSMKALFVCVT